MHSDWFACRGLLIRKMTFFHFSDEWGSMGRRTCWNKSAGSTWLSTHLLRIWRVYVLLRENGHAAWTDWSYKIFFPLTSLSFLFLQGRSYSVPGYAVLQDEWISRHVKGWYGRESVPQWHTKLACSAFFCPNCFSLIVCRFFLSHWDLFSTFISILIGQSVHHDLIGINTLVQSVIRTWMAQACRGRTDYGGWDKWWRSDADIVRHRVRWNWKVDFFQSFAAWKAFCQRSLVANPFPAALDEYDVFTCFHLSTFYWKSLNWNRVSFWSYGPMRFFSDGCHGDQGLGIWILDLQIPAGALILQRQLFLKRSCNDDIPTIQRHKTYRFQIRKILRGSFGRLDPTTRQRFTWCPDQVDGRDQPTAWTPLGQQRRWRFSTERAKCWSLLKKDELRAICWRLRRSSVWNLYLCIKI